ncbi:PTS system mannose/fructose/sorbose family transporter subunit IID [bacterium]|nr:PTS system mannose/fructose/sorbose family transporter subunit IID [bacterium]MBU1920026.1 PTS system mannose/fructose/sorbose family transporter subunit IID [bacterium]
MKRLKSSEKLRLIWRSLWIQVLLNYKTMQGAGYLHILWPWVKDSEHRANRVRRVSGFLNGHPVFSAFALGAMLKRLSDGDAENEPEEFDAWRDSLAGPLGMVGDSLIWERWKPALLALGVFLTSFNILFNVVTSDVALLLVLLSLIILYNIPLFALRWWALDESYEKGKAVLSLGGYPALHSLQIGLDRFAAAVAACIAAFALLLVFLGFSWIGFGVGFVITFALMQARVSVAVSVLLALLASLIVSFFI